MIDLIARQFVICGRVFASSLRSYVDGLDNGAYIFDDSENFFTVFARLASAYCYKNAHLCRAQFENHVAVRDHNIKRENYALATDEREKKSPTEIHQKFHLLRFSRKASPIFILPDVSLLFSRNSYEHFVKNWKSAAKVHSTSPKLPKNLSKDSWRSPRQPTKIILPSVLVPLSMQNSVLIVWSGNSTVSKSTMRNMSHCPYVTIKPALPRRWLSKKHAKSEGRSTYGLLKALILNNTTTVSTGRTPPHLPIPRPLHCGQQVSMHYR